MIQIDISSKKVVIKALQWCLRWLHDPSVITLNPYEKLASAVLLQALLDSEKGRERKSGEGCYTCYRRFLSSPEARAWAGIAGWPSDYPERYNRGELSAIDVIRRCIPVRAAI